MNDPVRWSDAGDAASEIEQSLVCSGQALQMPAHAKLAAWSGILAAIPPSCPPTQPAAGTSEPLPVSQYAPLLQIGKVLSVLALASGTSILGYRLSRAHSRVAQAPLETKPNVVLASEPLATLAVNLPLPSALSSEPRVVANPQFHPIGNASPSLSQLQEESKAVLSARQALRSNAPTKALRLLEQAQTQFRRGMLLEERTALMIEALARSGDAQGATVRAKSFLKTYPKSPHATDVRKYLAP